MGPKLSDKDQRPMTFTAVGSRFDKSKHVAVRVASGKGVDWNNSVLDGTDSSCVGKIPIVVFLAPSDDMDVGENFGQVPLSIGKGDEQFLPIARAMKNVMSSLCKEVEQDATMLGDSSEVVGYSSIDA